MFQPKILRPLLIIPLVCCLSCCSTPLIAWDRYMAAGENELKQRHYDAAEKNFNLARAEAKKFRSGDKRVAVTFYRVSDLYLKESKYGEAETICKQVLDQREKANPQSQLDIAESLNKLANVYALRFQDGWEASKLSMKMHDQTLALYKKTLAIREKILGPDDLAVAQTLADLAFVHLCDNRDDKAAEPLYQRALAIREKKLGPDALEVANTLDALGEITCSKARNSQSQDPIIKQRRCASGPWQSKKKKLGGKNPDLAKTLIHLGEIYQYQERFDEGAALFRRAMAIEERKVNVDNDETWKVENQTGATLLRPQRSPAAQAFLNRRLSLYPVGCPGQLERVQSDEEGQDCFWKRSGQRLSSLPGNIVEMVDNSAAFANKSLAFPLANARINNEFHPQGQDNISISGDRYTALPPINNLFSRPNPGLIVGTFSGGANSCCTDYEIYSLGDKVKELPGLENRNVYSFTFGDFHGDGHQRAVGSDMTFVYWIESRPDCPTPGVVLNYSPHGWHLSQEDMRIATIPKEDIDAAIAYCREQQAQEEKRYPPDENTFSLRSCVWSTMLNLIYAGHASEAWKFLDQYWPQGKVSDRTDDQGNNMTKAAFRKDFTSVLKGSPYWGDLVKLNQGQTFLNH